ncbi:MAG TPA: mechanosensitive ion channel [Candidatus Parcubacteria bacterium]|jgi:small conductance mechanosensitive channel|nr:mechanosensitive ion channel [Candidatus Parcubacteria bacterium]|tara:strand:- start:1655 stop:2194 length:540 start_codon:yes stop_codon:yes gene_type:complete
MNYEEILSNLIPWFLSSGIKVIVILIGAKLIGRFGKVFIEKFIREAVKPDRVTKDKEGEKKREDTLIRIFNSILNIVIWVIAIMAVLPEFGMDVTPILAGAGLLGLAIGMGAKNIIADFLAGIFIILEDQYRVGDSVKIAGIEGVVKNLNLRRTIIKDAEGVEHSIPNGQIKVSANKSR